MLFFVKKIVGKGLLIKLSFFDEIKKQAVLFIR